MKRCLPSLLSVLVVACSSGANSGTGSSPADACSDFVAALREGGETCGHVRNPPARDAELDAQLRKQCTNQVNAPGSGLTPAILSSCASKVRAACGDDDACNDIEIKGTLADGAPCGDRNQCAGGECKREGDLSTSRCGICVSLVPIGGSCGPAKPRCVKGATCDVSSDTCVAAPPLAEGEVCFTRAKPSAPSNCDKGLVCKLGSESTVVKCTRRAAAGATCTSESDCLSELTCVSGKCGSPGPEGSACTSSEECAKGACSKTTRTCVAVQWVASGSVCDSDERRCTRGRCIQASAEAEHKCVDPIPEGGACAETSSTQAPCDTYASCIAGTCQFFDPSTCK